MRRIGRGRTALVVVAALAVTGMALAATRQVARPAAPVDGAMRTWRLAFVRAGDIWVANGDGGEARLLVKDGEAPAWSPDRKRIAFVRKGNVWRVGADGRGLRQLTFGWTGREVSELESELAIIDDQAVDISWDPRASMITFSHWERARLARPGEAKAETIACCAIFDVPTDAGKQRPGLVRRFDVRDEAAGFLFSYHGHPAWSQSGKRLAFVRNGDIWVAERHLDETGRPTSLLGESYRTGVWAVDTTRLAAVARYDAPTYRGSRENEGVVHLSWSPDEKHLAYEIRRLGGSGFDEIHVVDVTRDQYQDLVARRDRRLVEDGSHPSFSPDGRYLAYERWDDGSQGIWAISIDGKTKRQLVRDGEQPAW
jgi:Tol biopolymer transport system component